MIRVFSPRIVACVLTLALFALLPPAQGATFKVLHSFSGPGDGCYPASGSLIMDANHNLYGTTDGETCNWGMVFEVASHGSEFPLYTFSGGNGGAGPQALVMDKKGNLWGTATDGGQNGWGLIFKINTHRRESIVHTWAGPPNDGCSAYGAMVIGGDGNFYGTTTGCGKHDFGTVFKLAPDGNLSLLYSFKGGRDGFYPFAGLTEDAQGNLYGTTAYGGRIGACTNGFGGCGTIFKLTLNRTKMDLYKLKGPPGDGYLSDGNVIMDASGNFYGTTLYGGRAGCVGDEGCGIVFKLASDGTETILHFFEGEKSDGANPPAGLIADGVGNLYGTTEYGGSATPCNGADGCGTVFEIAADGTETILHRFNASTDGANPVAGLVADGAGNYYGTAQFGGAFGYGTVFEITP